MSERISVIASLERARPARWQVVLLERDENCACCGRVMHAGTEAVRSQIGELRAHRGCADLVSGPGGR